MPKMALAQQIMKDSSTLMSYRRPEVKVTEKAITMARVDVRSIVLLSLILVLVVLLITGQT
jgi:hypothetical protein